MGGSLRKCWNRLWFLAVPLVVLSLAGWVSPVAMAQANATVNGVVKDPSGAAIPNARVELTNVNTAVVRTTTTNSDGAYAFPSVVPGVYTMRASAPGFASVSQPPTTLEVSQTATLDFQLKVGTTTQNVTVTASEGAALEDFDVGTGYSRLHEGSQRSAIERPQLYPVIDDHARVWPTSMSTRIRAGAETGLGHTIGSYRYPGG